MGCNQALMGCNQALMGCNQALSCFGASGFSLYSAPPLPGRRLEADDEDPFSPRRRRHQRVIGQLEVVVRQPVALVDERVHDLGVVHRGVAAQVAFILKL